MQSVREFRLDTGKTRPASALADCNLNNRGTESI